MPSMQQFHGSVRRLAPSASAELRFFTLPGAVIAVAGAWAMALACQAAFAADVKPDTKAKSTYSADRAAWSARTCSRPRTHGH